MVACFSPWHGKDAESRRLSAGRIETYTVHGRHLPHLPGVAQTAAIARSILRGIHEVQ